MSMADLLKVADTRESPVGAMKLVTVDGHRVVIANVDGQFFAFSNTCTHDEGPLVEGELHGTTVTCPWHFSQFDVKTGEVVEPPAEDPIRVFDIHVDGTTILIRVER